MSFWNPDEDEEQQQDDEETPAAPAPGTALAPEQKQALYDSIAAKFGRASTMRDVDSAQQDAKNTKLASSLGEAVSDYGSNRMAARGMKPQSSAGFFQGIRQDADKDVDQARQGRKDRMDNVLTQDKLGWEGEQRGQSRKQWDQNSQEFKHKQDDWASAQADNDPEHPRAAVLRGLASKQFPGQDFAGMSVNQIKEALPLLEKDRDYKLRQSEAGRKGDSEEWAAMTSPDGDGKAVLYNKRTGETRSGPQLASKKPTTHDEKVAAMKGEERARYDNATLGLKASQDMADALLNKGQNTFSVVGDNDFTVGAQQWDEAIGRMQSGGAINDDEAKRFRQMAPTSRDSAEIQKKKLREMQAIMGSRIQSMGLDPDESVKGMRTLAANVKLPEKGGPGTALAGEGGGDAQVATYARDHKLTYEAAKALLVKRGYTPNEQ